MDHCLITFASTQGAMMAQRALNGVCPYVVMPVPRTISTGCGIALRLPPEALAEARSVLSGTSLPQGTYAFYGAAGQGVDARTWRLEA